MSNNKETVVMERITNEIKKIDNKENRLFFYVIDTKGNPSGSLAYIYEVAYGLKNMGYDVTMLYNDEEFVGVGEWLGQEYAELPHRDTNDNISVSPSDVLFIPEVYSSVMTSTRNLPCKRVAILESFDRMTEFIPFGATWGDLGVFDAITTTESNAKRLKTYFPFINVHIIKPKISNFFTRTDDDEKKLIINVVTREPGEVNKIVKPFFWQYPAYSWVAFRELRGLSREVFAEALREGAITIWADDTTDFGYVPLEAMKAGSLVIGKVPAVAPEWMIEEGNLSNAGIWVDNFATLPSVLASVIRTWTMGSIPESIQEDADVLVSRYTEGQQLSDIKTVIESLITERKNEFIETLETLKNKKEENIEA